MQQLILIGCGGFAGSILRYLLSGWFQAAARTGLFPVGTLGVNVLGCLAIGLLGGYAENVEAFSAQTRGFLLIGLLGGFTTFSTFGYETLALVRDSQMTWAVAYVFLHLAGGLLAVWLGYNLSTLVR